MLKVAISGDALEWLNNLGAFADRAKERALDVAAEACRDEKNKEIRRTYARKIPTVDEYYKKVRAKRAKATAARKKAKASGKAASAWTQPAPRKPAKAKPAVSTPFVNAAQDPNAPQSVVEQGKRKKRAKGDGSRPAWERTGNWQNGQRLEKAPGMRRIIDTGPAAEPITGYSGGYAQRLANLPNGLDGRNRSNPAEQKAADVVFPQIESIVETEVINALNL